MKNTKYATIDAHVLRCKLHHQNNLKYSITLKTNKDQYASTQYKEHSNLIVDIDSHLQLTVDKYSFEHFPKLNLIVNAIDPNKQTRTVGTTFAHFKKEGVQNYKISQCSCKDKAFEVEIIFAFKILEAKNSNQKNKNKETVVIKKQKFFSQVNTPRHSRQANQKFFSPIQKQESIKQPIKESMKQTNRETPRLDNASGQDLSKIQKELNCMQRGLCLYRGQVDKLREQSASLKQKLNCLQELLDLQQQKYNHALLYIKSFERLIDLDSIKIEARSIKNTFKVIQQQDELLEINEELTDQLQKQIKSNQELKVELEFMRSQNSTLKNQLQKITSLSLQSNKESNQSINKEKQKQLIAKQLSIIKKDRRLKNSIISKAVDYTLQSTSRMLMISSRTQQKQPNFQQQQVEELHEERVKLESIISILKEQIVLLIKERQILKEFVAPIQNKKKVTSQKEIKINNKPPISKNAVKKQEQNVVKKDRNYSKEKLKPPIKIIKKGSSSNTNLSSNNTPTMKSAHNANKNLVDNKKTIGGASTNYQFKIQKQSQYMMDNQIRSQKNVHLFDSQQNDNIKSKISIM